MLDLKISIKGSKGINKLVGFLGEKSDAMVMRTKPLIRLGIPW